MCGGESLGSPSHGAHAAQACTRGPVVHMKVVVQTTYTPTGMLMQGTRQEGGHASPLCGQTTTPAWPCPWVLAGTGISRRRLTHGPALFDTQSSAVALTCPSRSKNLTQEVFLTLAASLDRSPDPPQLGPIRNRRDPGHGGPSCLASDGRQ